MRKEAKIELALVLVVVALLIALGADCDVRPRAPVDRDSASKG